MLVAILYGGYSLLFSTPEIKTTPGKETKGETAAELQMKLAAEVQKEALSAAEMAVVKQAAVPWTSDPFVGKKLSLVGSETKGGEAPEDTLWYTGYVVSGKQRLAVINGMEYQVGEQLVSGGYTVRIIEPDRVVLEGAGRLKQVTLPFAGEVLRP